MKLSIQIAASTIGGALIGATIAVNIFPNFGMIAAITGAIILGGSLFLYGNLRENEEKEKTAKEFWSVVASSRYGRWYVEIEESPDGKHILHINDGSDAYGEWEIEDEEDIEHLVDALDYAADSWLSDSDTLPQKGK